ncbi:hypothetical protein J6Z19_08800 [bacterium]|nr:hypothetical protein [bacterium]
MKRFFIFSAVAALFCSAILSCGGAESYKTPLVYPGDVSQSECLTDEGAENVEESYDVSVFGKDIIVRHFNILAPKNTTMGIVDRDGNLSYENKYNYYYLEAGDRFISFQEAFRYSSSEEVCRYNLSARVTHLSGGIYDFMIFNDKNELVYSKEVRIR